MAEQRPGSIGWLDLTIPDAPAIRDFYQSVVGWTSSGIDMGGYEDYCMMPAGDSAPVAGVCHARKGNAALPAVWLPYIVVENLEASMKACREKGGEVVNGPRDYGDQGSFCVIRDPAGAHLGLYQAGSAHPA